MAVRSKAYVWSRSITDVAKSNPSEGMDVPSLVVVVCGVGSDLCDKLITRRREFYRAYVSNSVWSRNLKNEEA